MPQLDARQAGKDRERGARWFRDLPEHLKNDLGDEFVLGTFDWRDWGFASRPSGAFLNGADEARMHWEIMSS